MLPSDPRAEASKSSSSSLSPSDTSHNHDDDFAASDTINERATAAYTMENDRILGKRIALDKKMKKKRRREEYYKAKCRMERRKKKEERRKRNAKSIGRKPRMKTSRVKGREESSSSEAVPKSEDESGGNARGLAKRKRESSSKSSRVTDETLGESSNAQKKRKITIKVSEPCGSRAAITEVFESVGDFIVLSISSHDISTSDITSSSPPNEPPELTEEQALQVFRDRGFPPEKLKLVSRCVLAAMCKGNLEIFYPCGADDTLGLKRSIGVGLCPTCTQFNIPTVEEILFQKDCGDDYNEGSPGAQYRCVGCNRGLYVSKICLNEKLLGTGKYFNHCSKHDGFGVCLQDIRMVHCDQCQEHYQGKGKWAKRRCPHCNCKNPIFD